MDMQEIFGEVIFAYTDSDALADGVLIDIAPLGLSLRSKPVNRITCAAMADFEDLEGEKLAAAIRAVTDQSRPGDGILKSGDYWIVENEVNGWTLMYPSDY